MVLSTGTPGKSEFSHGQGYVPDPQSDYQSQRHLPFGQWEDKKDRMRDRIATYRLDATNSQETLFPNMYYALGNPDNFGPGPALVQEKPDRAVGVIPYPIYRTGVYREE